MQVDRDLLQASAFHRAEIAVKPVEDLANHLEARRHVPRVFEDHMALVLWLDALDKRRRLANHLNVSAVFKALADPTRRHVLQLLRAGPKSAGELADHFPVSKPTMSAHFAVLREAGLVDTDKQGKTVMYRLRMSVLEEALMDFSQLLGLNLAERAENAAGHRTLRKAATK